MGHLKKHESSRKELNDLASELRAIEGEIKVFRVGIDGDEESLKKLREKWRDCVLKINVSVQGIHPSNERNRAIGTACLTRRR